MSVCGNDPGSLQAAATKKDFRGLLLLSLPVPSIFIYVFEKAEFLMDYPVQEPGESETVFWGLFC